MNKHITFWQYYKQQWKDIPEYFRLAEKYDRYDTLLWALISLFRFDFLYAMYLYDTKQIDLDERFAPIKREV